MAYLARSRGSIISSYYRIPDCSYAPVQYLRSYTFLLSHNILNNTGLSGTVHILKYFKIEQCFFTEAQVDGFIFMQLQEEDIKDLFTIFLDRFKVRKVITQIRGKQKSPTVSTPRQNSLNDNQTSTVAIKPNILSRHTMPPKMSSTGATHNPTVQQTGANVSWPSCIFTSTGNYSTSFPLTSKQGPVASTASQRQTIKLFQDGLSQSQHISIEEPSLGGSLNAPFKIEECVTIDDDDAVIILPPEPETEEKQTLTLMPKDTCNLQVLPHQETSHCSISQSSVTSTIPQLTVTSVYSRAIPAAPTADMQVSLISPRSITSGGTSCHNSLLDTSVCHTTVTVTPPPDDYAREKFGIMYASCHYSVQEMLQKKEIRGCSTLAQRYFYNAMRDAAQAVGIWEKPPLVCDISPQTKERFFEVLYYGCPKLRGTQSIVWHRLSDALHNRRKYLRDKESGKRILKGGRSSLKTVTSVKLQCTNSASRKNF